MPHHHSGTTCNSHSHESRHCTVHHHKNGNSHCYHHLKTPANQSIPMQRSSNHSDETTANSKRHCHLHHQAHTCEANPRDMYEDALNSQRDTANHMRARKALNAHHRGQIPKFSMHQDELPAYQCGKCYSNQCQPSSGSHVHPTSDQHCNRRCGSHRNDSRCCSALGQQHSGHTHHQDHTHRHIHQSSRNHSPTCSNPPVHTYKRVSNACGCHAEPSKPAKTPAKACACHLSHEAGGQKSCPLPMDGPNGYRCHLRQASAQEEYGAKWAWGPPLPAILMAQHQYVPKWAHG